MSRICPLFSGSSANSTYISSDNKVILIDCGPSFNMLNNALTTSGVSLDTIKAVAITHTHSDHINGLKPFLNHVKVPLIATKDTVNTLVSKNLIPKGTEIIITEHKPFEISGFVINSFKTSHDADGSCGYTVTLNDSTKVSVSTDLGYISEEVRNAILGSDTVLIESNHDIDKLKKGPYPPYLKMRILSDKGHLSNNACAAVLPELLNSGTKRIILGHLSRNNNTPLLAHKAAVASLLDIGAKENEDYILRVAKPSLNEGVAF